MLEADFTPDDLATIHDALAHPARVLILRILRTSRMVDLPDLRRLLEEKGTRVDTRGLQYHLHKLQRASIVEVKGGPLHDEVRLVRDVILRTRIAQQN